MVIFSKFWLILGLDIEILNSEFNRIRTSNLSLPNKNNEVESYKRKTTPVLSQISSKLSQDLINLNVNSKMTLKKTNKKNKSKRDVLEKYGIENNIRRSKKSLNPEKEKKVEVEEYSPKKSKMESRNLYFWICKNQYYYQH